MNNAIDWFEVQVQLKMELFTRQRKRKWWRQSVGDTGGGTCVMRWFRIREAVWRNGQRRLFSSPLLSVCVFVCLSLKCLLAVSPLFGDGSRCILFLWVCLSGCPSLSFCLSFSIPSILPLLLYPSPPFPSPTSLPPSFPLPLLPFFPPSPPPLISLSISFGRSVGLRRPMREEKVAVRGRWRPLAFVLALSSALSFSPCSSCSASPFVRVLFFSWFSILSISLVFSAFSFALLSSRSFIHLHRHLLLNLLLLLPFVLNLS